MLTLSTFKISSKIEGRKDDFISSFLILFAALGQRLCVMMHHSEAFSQILPFTRFIDRGLA